MTEKLVKEGYELAEKELKEKQVQEVKRIVLKTLEKIKEQEKVRDEAIDKIKILKLDIDDLKDGKLDRIVERQEKDEEAKKVSVVVIIKETHNHFNPWYVPYRIVWQEPIAYFPVNGTINCYTQNTAGDAWASTITCSTAKDATAGCYELSSHEIVNLR